ncbi:hypothetical protein [Sanyastnella coralliicola]|uniref:hypothetical protein n=1 Tax=Sanyastnella coralliicola TaxID=3069118 RepID=UPI0027B9D469|nr:hypothetical protein [Longitalea sp. SCSIO 12813]
MRTLSIFGACLLLVLSVHGQHPSIPPSVESPNVTEPLNIDYLFRGHFYASSPRDMKYDGLGGWGGSGNDFHKIDESELPEPGVGILIDQTEECSFYDLSKGMKVYLYNCSDDTITFAAQDSRLEMKIQAINDKGQWADIEYLPSSWCGNSYHTLWLPKDHFWEFTAPVFTGEFKTKLRIVVTYYPKSFAAWYNDEDPKPTVVYSQEYEGSVNLGQFWKKQEYQPAGLMDPYED